MGRQAVVKKVAVSLTVMIDFEVFEGALFDESPSTHPKSWSPAIELARKIQQIPGVYEVVSTTNMTMQNTGKEWEEDPMPGDAVDE